MSENDRAQQLIVSKVKQISTENVDKVDPQTQILQSSEDILDMSFNQKAAEEVNTEEKREQQPQDVSNSPSPLLQKSNLINYKRFNESQGDKSGTDKSGQKSPLIDGTGERTKLGGRHLVGSNKEIVQKLTKDAIQAQNPFFNSKTM